MFYVDYVSVHFQALTELGVSQESFVIKNLENSLMWAARACAIKVSSVDLCSGQSGHQDWGWRVAGPRDDAQLLHRQEPDRVTEEALHRGDHQLGAEMGRDKRLVTDNRLVLQSRVLISAQLPYSCQARVH